MDQTIPQDDSLTTRLQQRGREALESALEMADPLSCSLVAASTDTFNLARRLHHALERRMTQVDGGADQLERLSPLISQFVQLNRVGASMLNLHERLSK